MWDHRSIGLIFIDSTKVSPVVVTLHLFAVYLHFFLLTSLLAGLCIAQVFQVSFFSLGITFS